MERRGAFDYILLETSGLADPGNIAPLFWVDDGLGSTIYLDGTVTLVDAKNILRTLDEEPAAAAEASQGHHGAHATTAHSQISHADVIVLNKSDTVSVEQLETIKTRIRSINGLSKIHVTQYGQVPRLDGVILDIRAYDGIDSLATAKNGHSHLDTTISTISVLVPRLNETLLKAAEAWIQSVLWESTLVLPAERSGSLKYDDFEVHRLKGRLALDSGLFKMVQGVRDVFEITDTTSVSTGESRVPEGKLVLIGRGLEGLPWQESFRCALEASLR